MSRSNPTENSTPNPASRWFEWQGEDGVVRYYDKAAKETVKVGSDFTFLLLDQLACVRGWHEASQSGIYSNEVKDTRADVLVVKAFKEGILAQGFYKDIKDRVNNLGGNFTANLYLAYSEDGEYKLGVLGLKGAALSAWMEFAKAHRAELYTKAIRINGFTEGKKGRIVYRVPKFSLRDVSPAADEAAQALDVELQTFLKAYLKRNTDQKAETAPSRQHVADEEFGGEEPPPYDDSMAPVFDEDGAF